MKKLAVKITAVFFVLLFIGTNFSAIAFAADSTDSSASQDGSVSHALVLTSNSISITVGKTTQITASVTNVDIQPQFFWESSDPSIATVDKNGVVKGVAVGKSTIIATAYVDGETLKGEFTINITRNGNFLRDLLEDRQILSYQYSYIDDYYYTNDKKAWQHDFGFGKIYDLAAPYFLLEYDYIRVFFTYGNEDWMLQMWKGQYGLIFYGGEIGIYNRDHVDDGINEWTFFNCPSEEDWLGMEMTLWHEEINGTWKREFTREYDKYWWCTGFKNGSLRQQEPADELRMTGRITFKDEEMTSIVADGLKECGFGTGTSIDNLGLDQIYVEGNDIHFCWQNINDAESTMAIKMGVGFLTTMQLLPLIWPFILPAAGLFTVACLLVSVLL
ncbi:MAG: DUF4474 domain-containing protein [Ruminococcaceae bacterium]|nr:DUF4474 domain-containing protein [Oscillospiraceae bacterium]